MSSDHPPKNWRSYKMPWGTHRDKTLGEISANWPDYLVWLRANAYTRDVKEMATRACEDMDLEPST